LHYIFICCQYFRQPLFIYFITWVCLVFRYQQDLNHSTMLFISCLLLITYTLYIFLYVYMLLISLISCAIFCRIYFGMNINIIIYIVWEEVGYLYFTIFHHISYPTVTMQYSWKKWNVNANISNFKILIEMTQLCIFIQIFVMQSFSGKYCEKFVCLVFRYQQWSAMLIILQNGTMLFISCLLLITHTLYFFLYV